MRVLIRVEKTLLSDVRINLSRGEAAVSQQLLHAPKIGAPVEEVRGEAVPERVRAGSNRGQSEASEVFIQEPAHAP